MAKARSPNRDKAFKLWQESGGKVSNREIAAKLGEDEKKIAVWKQRDKWNVVQQSDKSVVQQKKQCCTTKKKPGGQPGNGNAKGHGAPFGNKNAVGNNGGAPPGNQNAATHGYYSKYIPIEDLEMLESAPGAGSLEIILKVAHYRLANLLKAQKERMMLGIGFGNLGAENYKLQDDFYEPLIQKQLQRITDIEYKISKIRRLSTDEKDENVNITIKRKERTT